MAANTSNVGLAPFHLRRSLFVALLLMSPPLHLFYFCVTAFLLGLGCHEAEMNDDHLYHRVALPWVSQPRFEKKEFSYHKTWKYQTCNPSKWTGGAAAKHDFACMLPKRTKTFVHHQPLRQPSITMNSPYCLCQANTLTYFGVSNNKMAQFMN